MSIYIYALTRVRGIVGDIPLTRARGTRLPSLPCTPSLPAATAFGGRLRGGHWLDHSGRIGSFRVLLWLRLPPLALFPPRVPPRLSYRVI